MFSLSRLLTGRATREQRAATDREILEQKSRIRDNLQAVKSATRLLDSISNVMALNRGSEHENRE